MQAESPKSGRSKISSKLLIISRNASNKSWMVPSETLIDVISIFVGDIWRSLSNFGICAARTIRNKLVAYYPSRVVTRRSLAVCLLSIITRLTLLVIHLWLVSLYRYVPLVSNIIYLFVEIHSFNLHHGVVLWANFISRHSTCKLQPIPNDPYRSITGNKQSQNNKKWLLYNTIRMLY